MSARLDGELDSSDAATLERHLAACAACRSWSDELDRLGRRLRLHAAEPVPDLTDAIVAGSRVRFRTMRSRRAVLAGMVTLAAVTAAALTVALVSPADRYLTVNDVVAPEPLGRAGVVYLTISNPGADDRLLAASSPVASRIGFHLVSQRDGVITMHGTGALLCSSRLVLSPASSHLMMAGLHTELRPGDSFPLTLHFAHHDPLVVDVDVVAWDELDTRL